MKIDKGKVAKWAAIFLAVMAFFTLISNKVNYIMTPEVIVTGVRPGRIGYDINAYGTHRGGFVTFSLDLLKEGMIDKGQTISVKFENVGDEFIAKVKEKSFDEDEQRVVFSCELDEYGKNAGIYDEQGCSVSFFYLVNNYTSVLPKEAVIREGAAFVYVIETTSKVLGERQTVRRREVTVAAEDEFNAAIEGGIGDRDLVVRVSSKPLRDGAAVRISR